MDPLDPADADEDPDGDGYTNREEYLGDSDPHDPESIPEEPRPPIPPHSPQMSSENFAVARRDLKEAVGKALA